MTVYVDDCLCAAATKDLLEEEVNAVHKKHPVSRIKLEKQDDGSVKFDLLGADVFYNAEQRSFRLSMEGYVPIDGSEEHPDRKRRRQGAFLIAGGLLGAAAYTMSASSRLVGSFSFF